MKFDLSRFRKIHMDEKVAKLRHPSGHEITIAINKLHPAMKKEMASLPMYDGGKVKNSNPKLKESKKSPGDDNAELLKAAQKTLNTGDSEVKYDEQLRPVAAPKPSPTPSPKPMMAKGGGVSNEKPLEIESIEESQPAAQAVAQDVNRAPEPQDFVLPDRAETPEQMPADAPMPKAPEQIDPELSRVRDMYNHLAANVTPGSGNDPRGILGPKFTFGPAGETPVNFDRNTWEAAIQHSQAEKSAGAKREEDAIQNAIADNKARAQAGLPPIAIPGRQMSAQAPQQPQAPIKPQGEQPSSVPAPQQPQDPYGTEAAYGAYEKGIGEKTAGINQEAQALSQQGEQQAAIAGAAAQKEQAVQDDYNKHFQMLDDERKAFQHDIQNQHIDPQHYFNNMNVTQKLATSIGLILGGIGGGMTGQGNQVMSFMNNEIDRDIQAQKANLGKSENLLSANMRQFGNLRDATDMTRIMQRDIVANQLQQAAAKAMSPMAKAKALQALGDWDTGTAQMQGQLTMRKTLLGAVNSGNLNPERFIEMVLPDAAKGEARKELKEAQGMIASRNNILGAFDKIAKLNTISSRIMNPIESKRQIDAILGAFLPGLSKETAGRFTEQDAKMLEHTLRSPIGASAETQAIARSALDRLVQEKMHFPVLKGWGIDPTQSAQGSRFDNSGQKRIKLAPPVQ